VTASAYPRLASFKTPQAFRQHLRSHDIPLDFDDAPPSASSAALARSIVVDGVRVGNRFCILPMEGWDGTREGEPSELTRRRWRNFGISGAKLMWGGEAVAVRPEARANPNQLLMTHRTQPAIASLREELVTAHRERFGANADGDLFVGLQLTHSGRFARPDVWDRPMPLAACKNPVLDRRFVNDVRVLTDEEIDALVDDYIDAARLARDAGFRFVDIKQCHGYFGHELLGAQNRQGRYGGSLENRTRFLRNVLLGIQALLPDLVIVVRLSIFDTVPYRRTATGVGAPEVAPADYPVGFGIVEQNGHDALDDSRSVLRLLEGLGVKWICTTAGSPYYNPHVQRPAFFPPVDGYDPPEDPLHGVARQIRATAALKAAFPNMVFVGSGYSYLQEWLPRVGQHAVARGHTDLVGLGRMVLSYPDLPADVLEGKALRRKAICRTFSDCTSGPRLGLVSGCFPLDPFYVKHPDAERLREAKAALA